MGMFALGVIASVDNHGTPFYALEQTPSTVPPLGCFDDFLSCAKLDLATCRSEWIARRCCSTCTMRLQSDSVFAHEADAELAWWLSGGNPALRTIPACGPLPRLSHFWIHP